MSFVQTLPFPENRRKTDEVVYQGSPHVQTCVSGRYATIFARYAKNQADTHFFIPDTHNVIMLVWLILSYMTQLACQGKISMKKQLKFGIFSCHSRKFLAPRDVRTAHSRMYNTSTLYSTVRVHKQGQLKSAWLAVLHTAWQCGPYHYALGVIQ